VQTFDVIVVGTGGMGTAAACQLARRGGRVLGLDRFPLAHDRGSSHGQTRLIRQAYYEHPDYVPLLRRAYEAWRDLEQASGRRLLVESGLVMAGPETGEVVPGALASARIHDLAIETLAPAEAAARWPAFRVPDDWQVVYERQGGYLFVEDCVRAHAEVATARGAELRSGVSVHDWRISGHDVVVETDAGRFAAAKLVLGPGPWAGGLGRAVADPMAVDRSVDAGEQVRIDAWIAAHLPALGRDRRDHATCLYTMSPDHHFVLGLHPDHPQVAIAAGFSGHGFKFASVVGEVLADLAITGGTPQPIGFLSPRRFATH
jgi:sarcosine oxidase